VCAAGLTIEREFLLRYRQPVMDGLAKLAMQHPRLAIWDPFPVLCPGPTCSAIDVGGPLFFDGDHLSAFGNRALYPSFAAFIERIGAADAH
jgi:hypothetical protein